MNITTFSIVIGTRACDAKCPFCVSKMTGFKEVPGISVPNDRNFYKAMLAAQLGGTTTVLFTGKGEPTLYPRQLQYYLDRVGKSFPFIELQTNGIMIDKALRDDGGTLKLGWLRTWYQMGLDTIALSVVSVDRTENRKIYGGDHYSLKDVVSGLHKLGLNVRLCVMMLKDVVSTPEQVDFIIQWCKAMGVEQLTLRPVIAPDKPDSSTGKQAERFVRQHGLTGEEAENLVLHVASRRDSVRLRTLPHGAVVYDVNGQNVCMSNCLTTDGKTDDIRTLIYYPTGDIAYSWQHEGGRLLKGHWPETS